MKTNHSGTETKRWIRTSPGIKAGVLLPAMIVSESQLLTRPLDPPNQVGAA